MAHPALLPQRAPAPAPFRPPPVRAPPPLRSRQAHPWQLLPALLPARALPWRRAVRRVLPPAASAPVQPWRALPRQVLRETDLKRAVLAEMAPPCRHSEAQQVRRQSQPAALQARRDRNLAPALRATVT